MQQRVSVVSQVGFGQTCFPSVSRMLSHSQSLPFQHRSVNTASVVNLILAFHRLLPNHAHCEQRLFSGFVQCSRITGATVFASIRKPRRRQQTRGFTCACLHRTQRFHAKLVAGSHPVSTLTQLLSTLLVSRKIPGERSTGHATFQQPGR